jgi:pimeloyl-ACP methyl ester carboxylesterase
MISQEIILARPDMFISLCLTSTSAGRTLPPLAAVMNFSKLLLFNRDPRHKVRSVIELLYPKGWLDAAPDEDNGFPTNREAEMASFIERARKTPVQPFFGQMAQIAAGLSHFVSAERLHTIRDSNVPVMVITGSWDNLVNPTGSFYLKDQLRAELEVFEGAGHAVIIEKKHIYNRKLLDFFKKASSI